MKTRIKLAIVVAIAAVVVFYKEIKNGGKGVFKSVRMQEREGDLSRMPASFDSEKGNAGKQGPYLH